MNHVDSSSWKLVLLPQASVPDGSIHFGRAYAAWKDAWAPVYQSVGISDSLVSDTFTRQHDRLALFHGNDCAALTLFSGVDLTCAWNQEDSYFAPWPELARRKLMQSGPRVLVCSAFTVARGFRKNSSIDVDVKELLTGSLIRYFVASPFDAMTGNMRNSKGMNDLMYRWGATPLMKDVPVHGEPSDLVGFFKDRVNLATVPALTRLLDKLWEKRIVDQSYDRKLASASERAA